MRFSSLVLICFLIALQFLNYTRAQGQSVDRAQWRCDNGNECPAGSCCSVWGWCGKSETHCTAECKSQCKNNANGLVPSSATDNSQSEQKATASSMAPNGSSQASDSAKETSMSGMSTGTASSAATSAPGSTASQSAKATTPSSSGMKPSNNIPTSTLSLLPGSSNKPGATPGNPSAAVSSKATSLIVVAFQYQVFAISIIVCFLTGKRFL